MAILLLSTGCNKHDENADKAEYFNCEINGQYWTYVQCKFCNFDNLTAGHEDLDTKHYSIMGSCADYPQTEISFFIDEDEMMRSDTIALSSATKSYGRIWKPLAQDSTMILEYFTGHGAGGNLIITSRTSRRIEGVFDFTATNTKQTVSVSKGTFSILL